ncbi:MAG: hypothetical protein KKD25_16225 [Gammaproteobacteria bacterium]|jgi:hypothetical protein|nr:hypothetical protein [Gammaproteobacteria bacterium]MBU0770604.1 hypothetical protein [Gammaproteobacteria bacterium]MBU0854906.1 hypothetical protein [Gammaproteobacteria bacterium]MBU1845462.1 hypothetical protein [Gammaproteobacteria bacterium]
MRRLLYGLYALVLLLLSLSFNGGDDAPRTRAYPTGSGWGGASWGSGHK